METLKNRLLALASLLVLLSHGGVAPKTEVYFSPDDGLIQKFVSLIDAEQELILGTIYLITHHQIAGALIAANSRGVKLSLVCDSAALRGPHSQINKLVGANIPILIYDGKKDSSVMHNKFFVFGKNKDDKATVWTGSFNLTYAADTKNQENALVTDEPEVIEPYKKQFEKIKERVHYAASKRLLATINKSKPTRSTRVTPDINRMIATYAARQRQTDRPKARALQLGLANR